MYQPSVNVCESLRFRCKKKVQALIIKRVELPQTFCEPGFSFFYGDSPSKSDIANAGKQSSFNNISIFFVRI